MDSAILTGYRFRLNQIRSQVFKKKILSPFALHTGLKKIVQELILPSVSDAVKNHFMPPYKGGGGGGSTQIKFAQVPSKLSSGGKSTRHSCSH